MLFLGTEKYPAEDEYSRYLREHGGDSNAFTMSEYTTYYFKVAAAHLDGALDRFAQFFVSPSFAGSCVEREMRAVDSESTNYSTEDSWRLLQVLKARAAEDHPFHRFDVGNLQTLGAEEPEATRCELVSWNREHYQAKAMRLVIVGKQSLAELEAATVAHFGAVRTGSGRPQEYASKPWPQDRLGSVVCCVPLKEARSISICWPLPPQSAHLYSKPELYIAHVLGHEGRGSLHDILNQRAWVDQLSAGPSHAFSDSQLFALNISLTPDGDANRDEVLALVFEYIALVRRAGPQEATFRELASMQQIAFAHKEEAPTPDDFALSAAMSLHRYPAKQAFRGPFAVDEWKPEVVAEYLAELRPDRCIVFLTSSAFAAEAQDPGSASKGWVKERWYGAAFRVEPVGSERLVRWQAATGDGGSSGLQLPEPNRFIPQDFSLRGGVAGTGPEASRLPLEVTPPKLLRAGPMLRLWHKTDGAFASPRTYALAHVHTPAYDAGPQAVAMMRLFCGVVYDDLNAFAYDASVAGLGYGLDFSDNISLSVGGFSDKLPDLLREVLERLQQVLEEAEACGAADDGGGERGQVLLEKLETQRQLLLQDYQNFTREEPWSLCSYYGSQIMLQDAWHLSEYMQVLEQPISLAALAKAVRSALGRVHLEMLVHGNATAEEALGLVDGVVAAFEALGASPMEDIPRRQVTKLADASTSIFEYDLAAENPAQENCCTMNIYQVGPVDEDLHRNACLSLACHIASTSAYQQLRTKEQLGYIVQAGGWAEMHVSGFSVLVQGNRLPPREVDLQIEAWLESFGRELQEMTEEEFASNVRAVISERTQRYARLSQEASRHWSEIQPRRYRFDRLCRSVRALEGLSKSDVVGFFGEHLAVDAPLRRKLSLRVLGTSADGVRSEASGQACPVLRSLGDIRAFKLRASAFVVPPAEVPTMAEMAPAV